MKTLWRALSAGGRAETSPASLSGGADAQPMLFIHTGLHKTGSTALQECLALHERELAALGVLYPRAGRPGGGSGHHNLAWELMRDRRYRGAYGTIDEAAAEIAAHPGPAVLSSEDFESLLDWPDAFDRFALHPLLRNRRVVLVLYLREQGSYFSSLFLQLTRNGMTQEAARVAEAILANGQLDFQEWKFFFDYGRVVSGLACWRNGGFILRNYHKLAGGSTVPDFLSFTCPEFFLPVEAAAARVNGQRDLASALRDFYAGRLMLPLTAAQQSWLIDYAGGSEAKAPELSLGLRQAFAARFSASNQILRRLGGKGMEFIAPQHDVEPALPLERLFSFETQKLLTEPAA